MITKYYKRFVLCAFIVNIFLYIKFIQTKRFSIFFINIVNYNSLNIRLCLKARFIKYENKIAKFFLSLTPQAVFTLSCLRKSYSQAYAF